MPRPLGSLTAAALATCALSIAIAMPSGAVADGGPVDFPWGPRDVVVNVTAGANDPVRGATVVAHDDLTGRVVSRTTTTGRLGYAVLRMLPMQSDRRITITATGGTSGSVGKLSRTDDALQATVQRSAAAAAIEVNVNPATTIQAAYLDVRPRATLANSEKTVARRLGLTPDIPLDEAGRYSRVAFSGEAFARAAKGRGGIDAYADWAAQRIARGTALPNYAAPLPPDDLPLRRRALAKQENIVASLVSSALGPLAEYGGRVLFCELGVTGLCPNPGAPPTPAQLPPEVLEQFNRIEQGINNLQVQLTTVRQDLNRIEAGLTTLSGQVQSLNYQAELTAVDAVVRNMATAAGLRAQGNALPDSTRRALENSLRRRQEINDGCPNFRALIGQLPTAVVPLHPNAACAREGAGLPSGGLMQYAQRAAAARLGVVVAGQVQGRVDAAGEYWLGELARNVFSANASSAFADQAGTSTRDSATIEATTDMFQDAIATIDQDGTGTYFGVRIPRNQVLAMSPDGTEVGTLYGIGTYRDPGECRGNTLRPVLHRFNQGREEFFYGRGREYFSESFYLPSGTGFVDHPASVSVPRQALLPIPGWVACTPAQLMEPPPPAPSAPATPGWQPAARPAAAEMNRIMPFLRSAALCHVRDRAGAPDWASGDLRITFRLVRDFCVPGSAGLPDQLVLPALQGWAKTRTMVLPNLQVSVGNDACRPWEIGTSHGGTRSSSASVNALVTAVGMQCPVIDLTPNARDRDGWNCVSANPQGRVATVGTAQAVSVTSSLRWLNDRSMGGFCPNWGWLPMPTGSVNYSQGATAELDPLWTVERNSLIRLPWASVPRPNGALCSPGFRFLPWRYTEPAVVPCIVGQARLQSSISALTRYYEPSGPRPPRSIRSQAEAPNWTANNDVAGDFVVGPLYTSNAVGAYVPGLSPGGPVPTGSRLPGGPRPPGAVRDLTVECIAPCTVQDASVRVRWRAPARSGSFPVRSYVVQARQGVSGTSAPRGSCNTRETECTFRNLNLKATTDSTSFGVWAVNSRGVRGAEETRSIFLGLDAPMLTPIKAGLTVRWSTPFAERWRRERYEGRWSYTATASPGGRSCTVDATRPIASNWAALNLEATTCTITGLDPGVKYTVTVAGTVLYRMWSAWPERRFSTGWDLNPSPPSAPASPGVRARPGAPAIVGVEEHPGRLRVAWSRPASDGFSRITGYTATAQPGGATCTTLDRLACDIDGLENGVEYTVTVTATNELGTGPPSAAVTGRTPVLVPSAPRSPLVRESLTRIEVQWSAPESDGGRPVTGYTATASPGGATCTTTGEKGCTIEGLSSGTRYDVTVTATNEAGTGPSSEPASAMTVAKTVPGAPGRPSVTPLPGGARVAWFAPDADGGTPVTGYRATATPGGAQCETTGATECVIRGLAVGTAHRVSVVAINTLGAGSPSPLSDAVTPQQKARADTGPAAGPFGLASPSTVPALPQPGAAAAAQRPLLAGVALRPRSLVPGLGGRLTYTLARPAAITITFTRGAGRGRDRVVRRIPAGRLGALAGNSSVRVLHTPANARRMRAGAWRMTVEARDAAGVVMRRTVPIRVRT